VVQKRHYALGKKKHHHAKRRPNYVGNSLGTNHLQHPTGITENEEITTGEEGGQKKMELHNNNKISLEHLK